MPGCAVTLQQVLDAREARRQRQLARLGTPLVSLTLNMPGPVKDTGPGRLLFFSALAALRRALPVAAEDVTLADTGCEAILVCPLPPAELKAVCLVLEERRPVGRLLDLDVLDERGEKLSRPVSRTCLVCGGPAAPCARSRRHGLEAVTAAAQTLLTDFAAEFLGEQGELALLREARLTPKPGLVDRRSSGAHRDMDLLLLETSAHTLRPFFARAAVLGLRGGDAAALQALGLEAEAAMLAATGGVNTHRGAIYAFGLLLWAMGRRLAEERLDVFETAAAMAAELSPGGGDSHGAQVRRQYGAPGARGEALAGYPHARMAWELLRAEGDLSALLALLAEMEDANVLYRGGPAGLLWLQGEARRILALPLGERQAAAEALDHSCIRRGLSPGGSADLLAAGYLLRALEPAWRPWKTVSPACEAY